MTAKQLRKLRKAARTTQMELSERSRVGRVRLSFAENGHIELTPNEEARIRRVITQIAEENAENLRRALATEELAVLKDGALASANS